jgi:hypothetical protein
VDGFLRHIHWHIPTARHFHIQCSIAETPHTDNKNYKHLRKKLGVAWLLGMSIGPTVIAKTVVRGVLGCNFPRMTALAETSSKKSHIYCDIRHIPRVSLN